MARIRLLPESLTNKIAAGEVVERPASVVKELVENSLDAGAARIQVDIGKAGRELIAVADDGCGMERDDALLALERYATSKISTDEDLFSIRSLGFRGEALPSIASVSRMNVVTRSRDAETGVSIRLEGGKILEVLETGAAKGTLISVRNLFYNVPARRKFLKSMATEFGHIADIITAASLGYPEVGFFLRHDNKSVMSYPAVTDPRHRISAVLSRDAGEALLPVEEEGGRVRVAGWVAPSEISRSTGRSLFLFVNKRIVSDRVLTHAVMAGFSGRLPKGRYPLAVIFVSVPENEVDVNVHPAKAQVRFARQGLVHEAVARAVSRALAAGDRVPWAPEPRKEAPTRGGAPARTPSPAPAASPRIPANAKNAIAETMASYAALAPRPEPPPAPLPEKAPALESAVPEKSEARPQAELPPKNEAPPPRPEKKPEPQAALFPEQAGKIARRRPRIIGQLARSFVLCESEGGLLVVDQHAAHERVLFEAFRQSFAGGRPQVQNLLLPATMELSHAEAAALTPLLPVLEQAGLFVSSYSGRTFAVTAVPAHLSCADAGKLLRELAEKAAETGRAGEMEKVRDELCAVMACHGSVRANQDLSRAEMEELLKSLEACESPSLCPHGRPVFLTYTRLDLEKGFKRR